MRPAVASLFVAATFFVCACGSPAAQDEPDAANLPPELTTPVAAAQEANLTVYWLGRQFDVEGLTFYVIGGRFEHPAEAPFLRVNYHADFEEDGAISFRLTTYGPEGWDRDRDVLIPSTEGVTRQAVVVRGWPAELFSIPVGRWTNQLVIVDTDGSVVVARANASISNFRQVNPLNDPDRLLAVLENLRPYPE